MDNGLMQAEIAQAMNISLVGRTSRLCGWTDMMNWDKRAKAEL